MKKLQLLCTIILASLLFTGTICAPALAAETPESAETITCFEDGSYLVTRITYDSGFANRANQKSETKHQDYYNGSRQLMWTFRVHGTFDYDGNRAEATSADYSYDIYHSQWSFNGGSASYSGATATAAGSFTHSMIPHSVTLSLTCSPKGSSPDSLHSDVRWNFQRTFLFAFAVSPLTKPVCRYIVHFVNQSKRGVAYAQRGAAGGVAAADQRH